jgi:hypothetical protein
VALDSLQGEKKGIMNKRRERRRKKDHKRCYLVRISLANALNFSPSFPPLYLLFFLLIFLFPLFPHFL